MAPVVGRYHGDSFNCFPNPSLVHKVSSFLPSAILERAVLRRTELEVREDASDTPSPGMSWDRNEEFCAAQTKVQLVGGKGSDVLNIQTPLSHPRHTELKCPRWGPGICIFNMPQVLLIHGQV